MRIAKKHRSLLTAACVLAAFLIGGSFVPNFLKPANFLNVIRQCSIIAICAVGVTQVIVIKGIDLSVGGNVTFCGMLTGLLLGMGVPVPLAILAALVAGLLIGLISGVLHAYLEVPPLLPHWSSARSRKARRICSTTAVPSEDFRKAMYSLATALCWESRFPTISWSCSCWRVYL